MVYSNILSHKQVWLTMEHIVYGHILSNCCSSINQLKNLLTNQEVSKMTDHGHGSVAETLVLTKTLIELFMWRNSLVLEKVRPTMTRANSD